MPVEGYSAFSDSPSPITLAASYISRAERQRKMGIWSPGEVGDIWLGGAGGEDCTQR